MSERGFGKAIRSLVTKGYVIMDGDQVYRLTENGSAAAAELATQDAEDTDDTDDDNTVDQFTRRLTVVMPRQLQANAPTHVMVGIQPLDEQTGTAEMVTRLSVLNGEPETPQEASFDLNNDSSRQDFLVTAGSYTQARVKVEVYQLGPNPATLPKRAASMSMSMSPTAQVDTQALVAYGADIVINEVDLDAHTAPYTIRYPRRVVLRFFLKALGRLLMFLLARPTITGKENLPASGPPDSGRQSCRHSRSHDDGRCLSPGPSRSSAQATFPSTGALPGWRGWGVPACQSRQCRPQRNETADGRTQAERRGRHLPRRRYLVNADEKSTHRCCLVELPHQCTGFANWLWRMRGALKDALAFKRPGW